MSLIHGDPSPSEPALSESEARVEWAAQDELAVAIGEVVNVLREGGPVEVRPKVVLAG